MKTLLRIIFIITLLELFVGGGGRVFEIGAATLRIALFSEYRYCRDTLSVPIKNPQICSSSFNVRTMYFIGVCFFGLDERCATSSHGRRRKTAILFF